MTPTEQDKELRKEIWDTLRYNQFNMETSSAVEHILQLFTADRERVALGKEEMTLRYAIHILQDTNKEFALENLQRQLDKNLAQQEEE